MEHPEILPLIVIVIGILLSSLRQKSKKATSNTMPPKIPVPSNRANGHGTMPTIKSSIPDEPMKPKTATKIKNQRVASIIQPPEEEGKQSVTALINDDAYSQSHPDLPTDKDWRKAIIAHEILKRKF